MEITSFVLGIFSAIFVLGIVASVFGARKIMKLKDDVDNIYRDIETIHRRISEVSDADNRRIDIFHRDIDERFNFLLRDLDSRFDKLENRLKAETKGKQLLKD